MVPNVNYEYIVSSPYIHHGFCGVFKRWMGLVRDLHPRKELHHHVLQLIHCSKAMHIQALQLQEPSLEHRWQWLCVLDQILVVYHRSL